MLSERDLKYAVLHLQAATEVLLKARLVGEHWSLVFRDPGSATMGEFTKGVFQSCDTDETIKRLRGIAQVEISPEAQISIKNLSKDRNALMHYGHTGSAYVVEARAAETLGFLLNFIDEQLRPMLEKEYRKRFRGNWNGDISEKAVENLIRRRELPDVQHARRELAAVVDTMSDLRTKLGRIEKLVDQRMKELRGVLANAKDRTIHCPDCRQLSLVIKDSGGTLACAFCFNKYDSASTAATEYVLQVAGLDNASIQDCPECSLDRCLVIGVSTAENPSEEIGLCFWCLARYTEKKKED